MGNPKKPSSTSEPVLHAAARSGDMATVQSILNSNPLAVNSRDRHSRTPNLERRLHLAAWSGQTEVVNYLCKNKADVGATAIDDMGAVHFAAQKGHLEVVRTLLSAGVSVKASTRKGMTPLHYASLGSDLELVKYLVRKGANLSAKTKGGKTPIDLSSSEEIRLFLEEAERLSKKGDANGKEKDTESDIKPMLAEKTEKDKSGPDILPHDEEQKSEDEKGKRKGDEDDVKEASSEPKKARIALNHLLAADDNLEDEENI